MRKWVDGLIGGLTLLYPFAVYKGIQYFEPWKIAAILAFLLFVRLMTSGLKVKWNRLLLVMGIVFCGFAIWNNDLITLRFYPVIVSVGFFLLFAGSLYYPPPIIERIARLQHPDLPEQGIIYTRKVTKVWCVFFVINGSIATATALWCSFAWWSLYNGLIAYLLSALLMGIEYLVRIRTQPHVR
jgi:uncharacterized membrane protein